MNRTIIAQITQIILLGISIWFGVISNIPGMINFTFLYIAVTIFANLDKISSFKATRSGIEATTREAIYEAKQTIAELKQLAIIVAKRTLSQVKRAGRLGTYSDLEQETIKADIISIAHNLKFTENEIDEIFSEWNRFIDLDYALLITKGIQEQCKVNKIDSSSVRKTLPFSLDTPLNIEKANAINNEFGEPSENVSELIKDLKYFRAHKTHRRPETWASQSYS